MCTATLSGHLPACVGGLSPADVRKSLLKTEGRVWIDIEVRICTFAANSGCRGPTIIETGEIPVRYGSMKHNCLGRSRLASSIQPPAACEIPSSALSINEGMFLPQLCNGNSTSKNRQTEKWRKSSRPENVKISNQNDRVSNQLDAGPTICSTDGCGLGKVWHRHGR